MGNCYNLDAAAVQGSATSACRSLVIEVVLPIVVFLAAKRHAGVLLVVRGDA